ncbi:efflux transporter outer membrane subunit [Sphingomonas sp.]|uniref:efflux transporter outer membrane subunit n=1 Tax=Sphingomonas sp. TaxID=28214 RepID=UPI001D5D1FFC|nr:efflux transporter outer membrane subunit [Sphingomonas sp.]MBX9797147.1 efflux transporter outer membrane subunit [Sphingomonas sp.]
MRRLVPMLALALPLAACVVGPNYVKPAPPMPSEAKLREVERAAQARISAQPLPDHWWRLYNDPELDRLIRDALAANTDLRVAAANLLRARAVLMEQRGARLPTFSPGAQVTRQQGNSANAAAFGAANGPPRTFQFDLFQLNFDASYEIDLFGGITRAIQAGRGDVEASAAQLDAARVSVAAETARAYVTACGNAAQLAVARETVDLQRKTSELTKRLFAAGRGTRRDVDQADVLLAQTEALVPGLEAERRAALYALATLTGRPAEQVDAAADRCTAIPQIEQPIPVGDGAALIARRPDVRAAERTLAADTARIGVAVSQLYPRIQLLGRVGLNAVRGSELFQPTSVNYSVGPLISWTFPNQTVARARIRQARAQSEASLARFDGAVLTALNETEQALARYAGALDQREALRRAEQASASAARVSRLRFDSGLDNFLQLTQSERDRANARAALAQAAAAVAVAQVSLFRALGGGWEGAPTPARRLPDGAAPAPAKQ